MEQAIRGHRQPKVTLQDGRNTVRLITAIYEASRRNTLIEL